MGEPEHWTEVALLAEDGYNFRNAMIPGDVADYPTFLFIEGERYRLVDPGEGAKLAVYQRELEALTYAVPADDSIHLEPTALAERRLDREGELAEQAAKMMGEAKEQAAERDRMGHEKYDQAAAEAAQVAEAEAAKE